MVHSIGRSALLSLLASFPLFLLPSCAGSHIQSTHDLQPGLPGEARLQNIRQITFGGTNAEAYWSFDGKSLAFQHKGLGDQQPKCDQIYRMDSNGESVRMVSDGQGRTTCSYFFPDDSRILFSSTAEPELGKPTACPKEPDMSQGYVWPIYPQYQIYAVKPDGSDPLPLEPGAPRAYNAETTVCKDGSVVFTSDRSGDLELYTGKLDSRFGTISDIRQITHLLGYDGGAFFSADCKQLVWRASRPRAGKEATEYKALLEKHLVRPTELEIWTSDADGSHARQVTRLEAASFAPFFTPDGKKIIFASNPRDPHGRHFDLYLINTNGTGLERVTYSNTFESFPMFSPDGKRIAFSSNRNASQPHETNVFVADWIGAENAAPARPDPLSAQADPADRFYEIVRTLSAPEMEGRGIRTQGLLKAQDFIEGQMRAIGLKTHRQKVEKPEGLGDNVLGELGKGCARGLAPVVIGAHLDHLGVTPEGLHPGADDNASGVAAILETARILATDRAAAKRCFIFAAFTGEETGIIGSSRYAESLVKSGKRPKAMLNLDVVGRLENNQVTVFGSDSAPEWKTLLSDECPKLRLSCTGGGDGLGPSDQMAFYLKKIPVLHFFTGAHPDYHRPTDTADKINATGGVQVAELVAQVAIRTASASQTLTYRKSHGRSALAPTGSGDGRASGGAYLGTIPNYSEISSSTKNDNGVPLAGARPGSPADLAGIREKDTLLAIRALNDPNPSIVYAVHNLQDFMAALGNLHPGQKVVLEILREGKKTDLPATIGVRGK
ncbi:MAG: M20/M25/M40 family metallo-hydrolase [Oligoflexia bacterium]|nr:M20/M25/M40 family metallo-hydrolase [Oligoflexia bacterium]